VEVGLVAAPGWAEGVALSGDYAYVSYTFEMALQVVDISMPTSPREVGFVYTSGHARGVAVAGEYVYMADDEAGLEIFLDCAVFTDGFESGDTSAWSSTVP
jgi:hypothetical protein